MDLYELQLSLEDGKEKGIRGLDDLTDSIDILTSLLEEAVIYINELEKELIEAQDIIADYENIIEQE